MRTLAALALALSAATPAFAQDADFSGPRVDVAAGYDNVGSSFTGTSQGGAIVAGTVGYDVRKGDVVFGVEGEASLTTVKDTENFGETEFSSGRDFYAGVRLGVVVNPNTLVYVKGGYANGRLTSDYADEGSWNYDYNGYRVGAGVERQLNSKLYAKGEYRYTNYEYYGNRHTALVGLGYRF